MKKLEFTNSVEAWLNCHEEDRWVFNKLELSLRLGLKAGLPETEPINEGWYVGRPIYDLSNMGIGAKVFHLDEDSRPYNFISEGKFWVEHFATSEILSIDYQDSGKAGIVLQSDAVVGTKTQLSVATFKSWKRTDMKQDVPAELKPLLEKYSKINVQYAFHDDMIIPIDCHLHGNKDFISRPDAIELIPVLDKSNYGAVQGWISGVDGFEADFAPSERWDRLGFIVKNKK